MYGYYGKKLHVYHLGVKGYNLIFFCMTQFEIVKKVIDGIYPGVATTQLDILAAEIAASMTTIHPDYAVLAARIEVSNLHKETKKIFSGRWIGCSHNHMPYVLLLYLFYSPLFLQDLASTVVWKPRNLFDHRFPPINNFGPQNKWKKF